MLPNVDAPSRQEWHLIHWVLWGTLGLALLLAATTYADYGATFDEALQAEYGELGTTTHQHSTTAPTEETGAIST